MPLLLALLFLVPPLQAQSRAAVLGEREATAEWLRSGDDSPVPAEARAGFRPAFYPYDGGPVFLTRMRRAPVAETVALTSAEGVLIRMTRLGTVTISLAGEVVELTVYRVPVAGRLYYDIHLRDATNGDTTPAAGRWLDLIPMGDDRFLIDVNRARLPWCAYDPALPCPAAWPGAPVPGRVELGERLGTAAHAPGPPAAPRGSK